MKRKYVKPVIFYESYKADAGIAKDTCVACGNILVPADRTAPAINDFFMLSDLGSQIWKMLCEKKDKEEIAVKLLADHDVEESVLRKDIELLYQNFVYRHALDA